MSYEFVSLIVIVIMTIYDMCYYRDDNDDDD